MRISLQIFTALFIVQMYFVGCGEALFNRQADEPELTLKTVALIAAQGAIICATAGSPLTAALMAVPLLGTLAGALINSSAVRNLSNTSKLLGETGNDVSQLIQHIGEPHRSIPTSIRLLGKLTAISKEAGFEPKYLDKNSINELQNSATVMMDILNKKPVPANSWKNVFKIISGDTDRSNEFLQLTDTIANILRRERNNTQTKISIATHLHTIFKEKFNNKPELFKAATIAKIAESSFDALRNLPVYMRNLSQKFFNTESNKEDESVFTNVKSWFKL